VQRKELATEEKEKKEKRIRQGVVACDRWPVTRKAKLEIRISKSETNSKHRIQNSKII